MSLANAYAGRRRIGTSGSTTQDQYEIVNAFGGRTYVLAKNQQSIRQNKADAFARMEQGYDDNDMIQFLNDKKYNEALDAFEANRQGLVMKTKNRSFLIDRQEYKKAVSANRDSPTADTAQRVAVANLVQGWRQFVNAITTLQSKDEDLEYNITQRNKQQYINKQLVSSQQSKIVQYLRGQKQSPDIYNYIQGLTSYQQAYDSLLAQYKTAYDIHSQEPSTDTFQTVVKLGGYLLGLEQLQQNSSTVGDLLQGQAIGPTGYLQAFVAQGKIAKPSFSGIGSEQPAGVRRSQREGRGQGQYTGMDISQLREQLLLNLNNKEEQQRIRDLISIKEQQMQEQGGGGGGSRSRLPRNPPSLKSRK